MIRRIERRSQVVESRSSSSIDWQPWAQPSGTNSIRPLSALRSVPYQRPIGRRVGPEIDDDVEDRSPRAANELGLQRRGDLIVQAADRALLMAQAHVGLHRREVDVVLANSRWHQARMKRPRSSSCGSGSISQAPGIPHSRKSILAYQSHAGSRVELAAEVCANLLGQSVPGVPHRRESRDTSPPPTAAPRRSATGTASPEQVAALVTSSLSMLLFGRVMRPVLHPGRVDAPLRRQRLDDVGKPGASPGPPDRSSSPRSRRERRRQAPRQASGSPPGSPARAATDGPPADGAGPPGEPAERPRSCPGSAAAASSRRRRSRCRHVRWRSLRRCSSQRDSGKNESRYEWPTSSAQALLFEYGSCPPSSSVFAVAPDPALVLVALVGRDVDHVARRCAGVARPPAR